MRLPVKLTLVLSITLLLRAPDTGAQKPPEDSFIMAGDIQLHYLDFGGTGIPLILLHSESWVAYKPLPGFFNFTSGI